MILTTFGKSPTVCQPVGDGRPHLASLHTFLILVEWQQACNMHH